MRRLMIVVGLVCLAFCAAGTNAFPFRVALVHGIWKSNDKYPGNGHDLFDLHLKAAGWPAVDKYPSTTEGLDRLVANLKNYDVVIISSLFNYGPKRMDVKPYAKAFRAYLENGGSFFIMDALYGLQEWIREIDPGLDFSTAKGCGAMLAPTQPLHPTLSFPNTLAGVASWGHLVIPENSKWEVVCGCCGGNAATICVAKLGKGHLYITSTVQGGRFGTLQYYENFLAFLRTEGKIAMDTADADLIPEFIPGKNVSYDLPPVSNRTDKAVAVELRYAVSTEKESRVFSWKKTLAPFADVRPVLTSDIPMRGEATVRMDILVDGKAIAPRTKKIVLPELFRVTGPRYRNYLPVDEREPFTVGVEVMPYADELASLTCRLRVPGLLGTNDAGFAEVAVSNRYFRVPFTVSNRQALHFKGPVMLEGTLLKDGKVLATAKQELTVLPGRNHMMTVRDDLVFLSDGKPFFPLGIYHVKVAEYADCAEIGFNMAQEWDWYGAANILESARTNNLKIAIEQAHPDYIGYRRGAMANYIDHPNFGFWYVADEPGLDMTKADTRYMAMREDFKHPAYLVSCNPQLFAMHQRACDVFAYDTYPIRNGQLTTPLDKIARMTDRAIKACRGDKPFIFVLQAFGKEPENMMVNMAYQTIIHGASGIFWYAWDEGNNYGAKYDPETRRILKRLCGEIKTLEPFLFNRTSHVLTVQGGVHSLFGTGTNKLHYLLLCNPTDKPVSTTLTLFPNGKSRPIYGVFDDSKAWLKNGCLDVTLEPYAVRAYKW